MVVSVTILQSVLTIIRHEDKTIAKIIKRAQTHETPNITDKNSKFPRTEAKPRVCRGLHTHYILTFN